MPGGATIPDTVAAEQGPEDQADREDEAGRDHRAAEILDSLGDGFIAFGFDWRVAYLNAAAEAYFGFRREQAVGRVIWELIDNPPDGVLRPFLEAAMRARAPADADVPSDIHPGRWVGLRAFPLQDGLGVNFRDVTERRERERREHEQAERLAELETRLAFLLEVADTLRAIADPDQVLNAAARLLGEKLGAARAGYAEIARDDARLVISGDWALDGLPRLTGQTIPFSVFGPEIGPALRAGGVLALPDVLADPRTAAEGPTLARGRGRALMIAPLVRDGRLEALVFVGAAEPRVWTPEERALAEEVASRTWSALGRARSQRALRESEARFRAMADSAPSPVWVTGPGGAIEFVNRAFCDLAGKPFEDLLGDAWIGLMHPDDAPRVARLREDARRELAAYGWEGRFRTGRGEWRWMRASAQPRFDANGVFQGYVGLAMDVTDARRAEERQRLLINELNHRVKNTLATVQSLAHQTFREGVVARDARRRFTDRLLALSAAHNVLTRENWEGAELSDIVREAVRPYENAPNDDPGGARIAVAGPTARLSPPVALAVSMALHELATNAVKYGALSTREGRIAVEWRLAPERDTVELEWVEAGGPPVEPPSAARRTGFGSRLLTQGLAAELSAPADLDYRPDGVACRLRVPVIREG
ncbi:PAS domain S-box protein [Phenylobacterium sp.]|uniref:sensor histidine kinase n=1 Tax=Phenylobacterium sp. TaxID=1871053 RepID=UPI0039593B58